MSSSGTCSRASTLRTATPDVHVGRRLDQHQVDVLVAAAHGGRRVARLGMAGPAGALGEPVEHHPANVVARLFVSACRGFPGRQRSSLAPQTRKYGRSDPDRLSSILRPPLDNASIVRAGGCHVMTADTPPIAAPDAAPKKVYERKTRVPDWLTDVVLIITGVFGVWAVVLVVLTFIGIAAAGVLRHRAEGRHQGRRLDRRGAADVQPVLHDGISARPPPARPDQDALDDERPPHRRADRHRPGGA